MLRVVHPAGHNANPNPLVTGPSIRLQGHHGKIPSPAGGWHTLESTCSAGPLHLGLERRVAQHNPYHYLLASGRLGANDGSLGSLARWTRLRSGGGTSWDAALPRPLGHAARRGRSQPRRQRLPPVRRAGHRVHKGWAVEARTDRAPVYPAVLSELLPAAWLPHQPVRPNPPECDHGRLKRGTACNRCS
jgi:hypothetical protein